MQESETTDIFVYLCRVTRVLKGAGQPWLLNNLKFLRGLGIYFCSMDEWRLSASTYTCSVPRPPIMEQERVGLRAHLIRY